MTPSDPSAFPPTLSDTDLYLLGEGTHHAPWRVLGARLLTLDGVAGAAFAVWAPNARSVSVVGEFCAWDGRAWPMRQLGGSGIWERFVPGIRENALYKYELHDAAGRLVLRADPYARGGESAPAGSASCVVTSRHEWRDAAWMQSRGRTWSREPVSIYEVHVGSWARVPEEGLRPLRYGELAEHLIPHVQRLGFTHVELMPVMEHPLEASWGYQVSGYYQPCARWGSPDDLRWLVERMHEAGIGVILDWVPGHFVKDDFALLRFDGTALYEHADPRKGEHPDWGTAIFNLGRNEVRQFLLGNAAYWLEEFHADGLRVDAVASMLYLDYSRREGEWIQNEHGGRENLDAVRFLRDLNDMVHARFPGAITFAEESTAWPGVTRPTSEGGLGFDFKWNLGWMHDTLRYFHLDGVFRKHHHDDLTFAMLYENTERFVNPLSHDEVVHGKGSLFQKMWGDEWQRFANLRALLAYQWTRPGKKLLFMGSEIAPPFEWRHDTSLPWHLEAEPGRAGVTRLVEDLGALYRSRPAFWSNDPEPGGFTWIDAGARDPSVFAFERWAGWEHAVVVMNLTPVPRAWWRLGVPRPGTYVVRLDTDDARYHGSAFPRAGRVGTEAVPWHGREQSIVIDLPPLAVLVLEMED